LQIHDYILPKFPLLSLNRLTTFPLLSRL
jgi:hypothetical protein